MLKIPYFFEKKNRQVLGLRSQTPAILPTVTVLLQNVLTLSPIKVNYEIAPSLHLV